MGDSKKWLQFSGHAEDFPYWSERFEAAMHSKKLDKVLVGRNVAPTEEPGIQALVDQKYTLWTELVQVLDKKTLMLVRRDCKGDGFAAWAMLQAHFKSNERPRILSLMEKLTCLKLSESEDVGEYVVRAEELACDLKDAGENVSNSMLFSIVLKGLSSEYDTFVTVQNMSREAIDFGEMKKSLVNFSNSKGLAQVDRYTGENAFNATRFQGNGRGIIKCYSCNEVGHKSNECTKKKGYPQKQGYKCYKCGEEGHMARNCSVV
jgi:hypothetical protein